MLNEIRNSTLISSLQPVFLSKYFYKIKSADTTIFILRRAISNKNNKYKNKNFLLFNEVGRFFRAILVNFYETSCSSSGELENN